MELAKYGSQSTHSADQINRCTLWVFPNIAMENSSSLMGKKPGKIGAFHGAKNQLVTGWLLVFV